MFRRQVKAVPHVVIVIHDNEGRKRFFSPLRAEIPVGRDSELCIMRAGASRRHSTLSFSRGYWIYRDEAPKQPTKVLHEGVWVTMPSPYILEAHSDHLFNIAGGFLVVRVIEVPLGTPETDFAVVAAFEALERYTPTA